MDTPHLEELYFLDRDDYKYNGIAFDGDHFYLTCQDAIYEFDFSMRRLSKTKTCQCYSSICYDPCLDCFWALAANGSQYAYRLDHMLREIDRIGLPSKHGQPTGISCSEDDSELMVVAGTNIYCIAKSGCMNECKLQSMSDAIFLCASAADKGYLCSGVFNFGSAIKHFTPNGVSCGIILPEGYVPVDMARGRCCHETFILAIKDNCYFRVISCHTENCKCFTFSPEPCCETCQEMPCVLCQEPLCETCQNVNCDPCHDQCCEPCCPPPCKKPGKEQELCDIIESIALIETALSHILNAEGEKLQKILKLSNDPETLLETNKSISTTISKITHLEYVLFEKLRIAQEMSECEEDKSKECESHFC